jgi:hypothetical protein
MLGKIGTEERGARGDPAVSLAERDTREFVKIRER